MRSFSVYPELACRSCNVIISNPINPNHSPLFEGSHDSSFAAPGAWKRMAEQMQQIDHRTLRMIGGAMIVVGLIALHVAR